jgi:hypothetical protein
MGRLDRVPLTSMQVRGRGAARREQQGESPDISGGLRHFGCWRQPDDESGPQTIRLTVVPDWRSRIAASRLRLVRSLLSVLCAPADVFEHRRNRAQIGVYAWRQHELK